MRRAIYEDDVIKLLNRGWKSGVYPLGCDVRALPSAQPETHEKRTETHACDLISRQAAIDAVEKESQVDGAYGYMDTKSIVDLLNALPPAEPDHNADISKKAEGDCISRQAVVKFFNDWISCLDENCHHQSVADMIIIKNDFKNLPSAQPEIIHCRECKHWREGDAYSYCNKLFNAGVLDVYDYMTAEDDFCSNAERLEK